MKSCLPSFFFSFLPSFLPSPLLSFLPRPGYYPDALHKANQDCFLVCRNFMRDPDRAVFAVFDGHGREGDLCAQFCRDLLVEKLGKHLKGKETEKDIRAGYVMISCLLACLYVNPSIPPAFPPSLHPFHHSMTAEEGCTRVQMSLTHAHLDSNNPFPHTHAPTHPHIPTDAHPHTYRLMPTYTHAD